MGESRNLSEKAMAVIQERDDDNGTQIIAVERGDAVGFGPILQVETTGPTGRLNVE